MKNILVVLLACVFLAESATASVSNTPIKKQETIKVGLDSLWGNLITIIAESGGFINVADKPTGIITFKKALTKDEIRKYAVEKAPMASAGYIKGDAYITIRVKPIEQDSTSITITTSQMQGYVPGYPGHLLTYDVNSNGKLEEDIFNTIKAQCGKQVTSE